MTDTPRIYVADLAAHNAGTLRGVWIDATKEPGEILAEVQAMLAGLPEPIAEEWALHDHEGFGGIHLSERSIFASRLPIATVLVILMTLPCRPRAASGCH